MSKVLVPDIGDFENIEVVEVLVTVGDKIEKDQDIIALESDKATMSIPTTDSGIVEEVFIKEGDKVSKGSVILSLKSELKTEIEAPQKKEKKSKKNADNSKKQTEILVLGSGPGGYTAAFRAADLGKKVILVERYSKIGGVCLNIGCIPSKTLLHTAQIINETQTMSKHGVSFNKPKIDINKINDWKSSIVDKLTGGLKALAKARKIEIIQGMASFSDANNVIVKNDTGQTEINFKNCIIAVGSRTTKISSFPNDDSRIMNSTDALNLEDVPKKMLIIGGGIIGLEMATVYNALGSKITIVELQDTLIPGADKDIIKPLYKRLKKQCEIFLATKVNEIKTNKNGLEVFFEGENTPKKQMFDKVLVAVGRVPNSNLINADKVGIKINDYGFIEVNSKMQTNVPHIFAIGDVVGQPMLAHKATHEGKVAAEVISGIKSEFDPITIPSVAYTDPEVAWAGLTENQAKQQNIDYIKGEFPWAASGRSLSIDRSEGLTKTLFEKSTGRLIGVAIVGTNAGELIAEGVLALEMGADAEDIGKTIHPHPTLSETFNFAAEMAEGTITDLLPMKKNLHSK